MNTGLLILGVLAFVALTRQSQTPAPVMSDSSGSNDSTGSAGSNDSTGSAGSGNGWLVLGNGATDSTPYPVGTLITPGDGFTYQKISPETDAGNGSVYVAVWKRTNGDPTEYLAMLAPAGVPPLFKPLQSAGDNSPLP